MFCLPAVGNEHDDMVISLHNRVMMSLQDFSFAHNDIDRSSWRQFYIFNGAPNNF